MPNAAERNPESSEREFGIYRINLDGEWWFDELGRLPVLYVQVYAFFAQLHVLSDFGQLVDPSIGGAVDAGDSIFQLVDEEFIPIGRRGVDYPWAGGWSSTNFYRRLVQRLYGRAIPKLVTIQYSSPGFLDLTLWITVAEAVRRCVNIAADTVNKVHDTYDRIYRGMRTRQMLSLDVREKQLKLSREELAFVVDSRKELERLVGLNEEQSAALASLSPVRADKPNEANELGRVKVLLSLLRRVMTLSEFQTKGKARF